MYLRASAVTLLVLILAACTSTPTPTGTPTITPTPVPSTALPTATLTPTLPPTPTLLPTPTPTTPATTPPTAPPTATPTIAPTATPTVAPTATPTATPTVTPTPQAWPEPDRIARGFFADPAIAVDAAGAVHIAVMGIGDDDQGIWYLTNVTGRWVKQQVAKPRTAYEEIFDEEGPEIAIDPSDGSAWIVFAYVNCPDPNDCLGEGIFLVNNAGGAWTEPVQLTGENTSDASLAVRDGHVYLAWDQYLELGGCYTCPSSTWFGTDASGEWAAQSIAGVAQSPQLVVNADGDVGILFTQVGNRYARQKANGSFVVERVPGQAVGALIAVDAVSGITWVASYTLVGEHWKVFLASRGQEGWSDPVMAVPDNVHLGGLGVHGGVVHLIWGLSGSLMYADNASGTFDTVMLAPADSSGYYSAFALGPSGRPYVVFTHDVSGPMGVWFLEGPEV